jgi:hypothetical protein
MRFLPTNANSADDGCDNSARVARRGLVPRKSIATASTLLPILFAKGHRRRTPAGLGDETHRSRKESVREAPPLATEATTKKINTQCGFDGL